MSAALENLSESLMSQGSRPNIYGYKPHHKQEMFHKSEDHMRIFLGGNRSGKTYAGVMEDVIFLTKDTRFRRFNFTGPCRGRAVAVDYDRGVDQILLPYFKQFIPPSKLKNGSWEDSYQQARHLLTLEDGSFVEFMTYEQSVEKFAGTSRHFTHYDEEPPKEIYLECQARLIDTNGYAHMTMTPVEGATWVFDQIFEPVNDALDKELLLPANVAAGISSVYRSEAHSTTIVEVGMNENPHLDEESQRRYLALLSTDEVAARQKGIFVSAGGKVFPNFNILTHVIESDTVNPAHLQRMGWQIYTSVDHGWNNPTAWLWHAVSPEYEIITFHEIYLSQTTIEEFSRMVFDYEERVGLNSSEIIRTGDPAMHQHSGITGTTVVMEYAMRNLFINTENVPRDRSIGVARMQMYLKINDKTGRPAWTITNSCPDFIKELKGLQFAKHTSKKVAYENNKKEEVKKKNDHAFDSAKYFATFLPDLSPEIVQTTATNNVQGTKTYTEYLSAMIEEQQESNPWVITQ